MMSRRSGILVATALLAATGCSKPAPPAAPEVDDHDHSAEITNRIAVPPPVRINLGLRFAKAERRAVSATLRVPGAFELLPEARREYRAILGGRIELAVRQFQRVEAGTVLYRIDAPAWRKLQQEIAEAEAAVVEADAHARQIPPLAAAQEKHEETLKRTIALWEGRIRELEALKAEGAGRASELTQAKATLTSAEGDLVDHLEKHAELEVRRIEVEAEVRTAASRYDLLLGTAAALVGVEKSALVGPGEPKGDPCVCPWRTINAIEVKAIEGGSVEALSVTNGGLAEESGLVLSVVRPELLRFRARGLQSDLGRLRDSLEARIVPPTGGSLDAAPPLEGPLALGLGANVADRTIDLLVVPRTVLPWARAGIAAHLEVETDGPARKELAVPARAVLRDGLRSVLFRRNPRNPDEVIRLDADLGRSDGAWVEVLSGLGDGDEVVLDGNYQLLLASSAQTTPAGHFHADGTFHAEEHK